MTAVTDQSRRPPDYGPWHGNSAVPSLATVDEEHTDLGHTDPDSAANMVWKDASGGCSDWYGCGCGWCLGLSRARASSGWGILEEGSWGSGAISSGWGRGGASSGCGGRGDRSGWGTEVCGRCSVEDVANFTFSVMRSGRILARKPGRGRLMELHPSKVLSYFPASCSSA